MDISQKIPSASSGQALNISCPACNALHSNAGR